MITYEYECLWHRYIKFRGTKSTHKRCAFWTNCGYISCLFHLIKRTLITTFEKQSGPTTVIFTILWMFSNFISVFYFFFPLWGRKSSVILSWYKVFFTPTLVIISHCVGACKVHHSKPNTEIKSWSSMKSNFSWALQERDMALQERKNRRFSLNWENLMR